MIPNTQEDTENLMTCREQGFYKRGHEGGIHRDS